MVWDVEQAAQRAWEEREKGAIFVVSHSGGKDSQAMMIEVAENVPAEQIVVIHAPLVEAEWPGTIEHIRDTVPPGIPIVLARHGKGRTLLERVEERGKWPDKARRWCTSDFKRGPIEREIRRWIRSRGLRRARIVSCLGMRSEEGEERRKRPPWRHNEAASRAGRTWYDWWPIKEWMLPEVLSRVEAAGQELHWAYREGMTRLSCSFCILGSKGDLTTAARLRPRLYARYCRLEDKLGHTLSPTRKRLPEVTGIEPEDRTEHEGRVMEGGPTGEREERDGRQLGIWDGEGDKS